MKINLGGLTDSDYENVTINSISYVPSLIVNISFSGNFSVNQLVKLSERNDSILVLSAVPFYLTSVTSHKDILIPKPFTNSLSTAREEEALIYLAIGAAIAFVLSAGVLVSILILVKKKDRIKDKEPLIRSQSRSLTRYQDPPQMIYSETFSQGLDREKERLHQFTPIDDNFAPIETDVDFVPRYIKDDERASWFSEGSILDTTTCNHKKNLSTFSDEGSDLANETDRRSQMSKSPFYWTLESHSPTPTMTCGSPSPLPTTATTATTSSTASTARKKPPRPPSRTDSLNPRSTTKARPKSSFTSRNSSADIPSRRLSVPVPWHMTSRPGSVISNHSLGHTSPTPTITIPPAPAISQEQIDKDVHLILRNLDIVEEG